MKKETDQKSFPLVSVCIPVYNGEKFIGDAVVSIQKQTYKNFKCHIINNSSKDNTEKVVLETIKNDDRFTLHNYNEFVDIGKNWNRTVNHIDEGAKYFKVVQADDYLLPDSIESMVDLLEKYPTAGIGTSYRIIGDIVYGSGIDFFEGNFHKGEEILLKHLDDKAEITGSVTQLFFRVEHLKKVPSYPVIFDPDEYHFDSRLAYEMFFVSDVVFDFKNLNYTRRHNDAQTMTIVEKYNTLLHGTESRLFRFKVHYPHLEKNYKIARRKYGYFLFKSFLRNDRKCIKWHKKFLRRKITAGEILSGIFWENRFGARLYKLLNQN
jgi:glycosyltransferase involved in cell wall biosynthesis